METSKVSILCPCCLKEWSTDLAKDWEGRIIDCDTSEGGCGADFTLRIRKTTEYITNKVIVES
jgi:hypothetical protein